jgi:HEAT repeat protein
LLAHHEPPAAQQRAADTVGPVLLEGLGDTSNRDVLAAIAVGLGLARYAPAAPTLRAQLQKYRKSEEYGGYLCIGLALMDDTAAVPLIEDVLRDSHLRPAMMSQAALALARLQARDAQRTLHGILRADKRFALSWAATAAALGHIGDASSVEPLVTMLGTESMPKLLRAFAAASLGLIADDSELPWNAAIAVDINYQALTETMSDGASGVLDIL